MPQFTFTPDDGDISGTDYTISLAIIDDDTGIGVASYVTVLVENVHRLWLWSAQRPSMRAPYIR